MDDHTCLKDVFMLKIPTDTLRDLAVCIDDEEIEAGSGQMHWRSSSITNYTFNINIRQMSMHLICVYMGADHRHDPAYARRQLDSF